MSVTDWETMRDDPTQSISIRPELKALDGFVDSVSRELKSGVTTFTLKTTL